MRYFLSILSFVLALCLLVGCQAPAAPSQESRLPSHSDSTTETEIPAGDGIPKWNDVPLSSFSIVYDADAPDYNLRAAEYIRDRIKSLTDLTLPLTEDNEPSGNHELVVGETNRSIPCSSAKALAWAEDMIPNWAPSAPIRRTSLSRISSLS